MNGLLVINVGDFMPENARASMRSAAARWGADYVEATSNPHPHLHPTFSKCATIRRLHTYERVAYFDADMLIRSDAPNVFEILDDPDRLYAVRDLVRNRPYCPPNMNYGIINWVRAPHHPVLRERTGIEVAYDPFIRNFFNAGFFICSPTRHREFLEFVDSHLPEPGDDMAQNGHFEQALFNYGVQAIDPSVLCYAPETWNYIDPDLSVRAMEYFVYHFTGAMHETLKPAIGDFPWTV